MSNPIVHAEIIGHDPDRLREFYGELFGWSAPAGDSVASAVSNVDAYSFNAADSSSSPVPIGIGGGALFAPRLVFYVGVENADATLARALELGATVVVPVSARPDGGIAVAQLADPEGNVIGIASPTAP